MALRTCEADIAALFFEVLKEQHPKAALPVLSTDSVLLETGLDSLGFAILISRLEERLGFDPFSESDEAFYPRTYGEFVAFYDRSLAS
jgi:acyl carrier protein